MLLLYQNGKKEPYHGAISFKCSLPISAKMHIECTIFFAGICHTPPVHTKNYYSHVFCTDCFYKYIFSAPKTDCSGDIIKKAKDKKEDKKETKEEEQEIKENAAAEEITSK